MADLNISVGGIATQVLVTLGKFNDFLCTPEGQKFANLNAQIIAKIFNAFGVHLEANTTATPAPK